MNLKKLSITSFIASSALFAGTYNVDVSHSNVGFAVKHMMITNVSGKFNDVAGSFEFDEKTNTLTSLNGEIIVASINTANEKRDAHLKEEELFDAEKFPKIEFKTTKIENNTVYGDFTMKGVTKNIKLNLENGGVITDPWGKQRAGFELTGKINRKDFGITWNKILETGGVTVGEEVKLQIAMEGILAK
ncbi:MAG: YceI family protein [Aliarcobacter sp.]|jgi:polyisoprenoid-binding protein YceI|nr:YceI family protein [Aliarcobacter sp.]